MNPVTSAQVEAFDAVVIGSGFGSLFFVDGFLKKHPHARVLVLERGRHNTYAWQLQNDRNSDITPTSTYRAADDQKEWNFTVGLGGGTNCWYGQTPRFHPNDFRTRTLYGAGEDWPLSYAELEPFYVAAERMMSVAGGEEMATILPRSEPFPQPAHTFTAVDRAMRAAQPAYHFPIATARASVATASRTRCCSSARCSRCPVDAKFTFDNGFRDLRSNAAVEFRVEAEVTHLDIAGGLVRGVVYRNGMTERRVTADLFVLGANAIHSPAILLRSGSRHPRTGLGLNEQIGYNVEVMLDGLDNFDGSTITTGLNYSLYDGDFRRQHGGALIYFENRWPYGLRKDFGRWRQIAPLTIVVEDMPQDNSRVELDSDGVPRVSYAGVSEYARLGVERSRSALESVLAPLPVESIEFRGFRPTESHVQGTLRMGTDPATSVVDAGQIHHGLRNLVVVGSAVFPTCPCANPSLSVAALSLRAAAMLS